MKKMTNIHEAYTQQWAYVYELPNSMSEFI